MRFSVIVPAYNAELYIEDCVRSVRSQGLSDWELIVVDDGSSDSTLERARAWAEKDDRIAVLHQENAGATAARLRGLRAARGEFVLYLDADDAWEPDLLSSVDEGLRKSGADLLMFAFRRVPGKEEHPFPAEGWIERETWTQKLISSSAVNMVWDKAVRREIALACQIGEEHEGVAEDLLMVLPILDRVGRFYYIDQPLYRYRAVLDSRSNAFRPNRHKEIDAARAQVLEYLVDKDLNDEATLARFYTLYVDRMLDCLSRAIRAGASRSQRRQLFRDVRGFALFQMARFYPLDLPGKRRAMRALVAWRLDGPYAFLVRRQAKAQNRARC